MIGRKKSRNCNEKITLVRFKQNNYYLQNRTHIREKEIKNYASRFHRMLDSGERIKLFIEICMEGPTSVFVIFNKCLYKRSIKWFDPDKYLFEFEEISDVDNRVCLFV